MSRHLKSIIKKRLKALVTREIPNAEVSASHRRGVCYLEFIDAIEMYYGVMNTHKEGRHYKKHIIVRRVPRWGGHLYQLYTYHFPKTWSAACVANRELIKEAQRQAHALEHDNSRAAIEWRIRFFNHYFQVIKGGAQPEPGMKRYSRFYQYTYVAIYRELQAARQKALEPSVPLEEISFEPIDVRPKLVRPIRHAVKLHVMTETRVHNDNSSLFHEIPPEYLHNSEKCSTFARIYVST